MTLIRLDIASTTQAEAFYEVLVRAASCFDGPSASSTEVPGGGQRASLQPFSSVLW